MDRSTIRNDSDDEDLYYVPEVSITTESKEIIQENPVLDNPATHLSGYQSKTDLALPTIFVRRAPKRQAPVELIDVYLQTTTNIASNDEDDGVVDEVPQVDGIYEISSDDPNIGNCQNVLVDAESNNSE